MICEYFCIENFANLFSNKFLCKLLSDNHVQDNVHRWKIYFREFFSLLFYFQCTYKFFNTYLKKDKRIKIKEQFKKINTIEIII